MTIKSFIEKAIEGGWTYRGRPNVRIDVLGESKEVDVPPRPPFNMQPRIIATFDDGYVMNVNLEVILLDPLAWRAVSKTEGWGGSLWVGEMRELKGDMVTTDKWEVWQWEYRMMKMIGALAEGKTIEDFLEAL